MVSKAAAKMTKDIKPKANNTGKVETIKNYLRKWLREKHKNRKALQNKRLRFFWRNRKVDFLDERQGKKKHFLKQNQQSVIKAKDVKSGTESTKAYWKRLGGQKSCPRKGGRKRTTKAAQKVVLLHAKTNLEHQTKNG